MLLSDNITTLKQISSKYANLLEKLGIFTIKDLLTYFPSKYIDTSIITSIKDLILNNDFENTYQIKVRISNFKNSYLRNRRTLQSARGEDETGFVDIVWFNQPFLKNVIKPDKEFILSGKLKKTKNSFSFIPSYYEEVLDTRETVHLARITPEYSLTEGISKKWFRNRVKALIGDIEKISDLTNELESLKITNEKYKESICNMHFPQDEESLNESHKLLSLYELTNIQLKLTQKRKDTAKLSSPSINVQKLKDDINKFVQNIPFELTTDQKNVLDEVIKQFKDGRLLNNLIQGDVGSGKTIIAIALSIAFAKQNYQVVILAPTTILAKQHYKTFNSYLESYGIEIELVTSDNKKTESKDILIGTSAVLARQLKLIRNLGLVVVDEQHKFGVVQREELLKPFENLFESFYPHFIDMTATPIPRTIARVFFGDITINQINTKPKGRLPIKTYLVPDNKRDDSYSWIEDKLKEGDQVYWVCPLISESDKLDAIAAEKVYEDLKVIFKKYKVALLHGKMKEVEKSEIMRDFLLKKYHILVSTSVIEVGIDVANASIMVVESAERFGLAQLHQIRGRVGRGEKQSWCFLFHSKDISKQSKERLKFLSSTNDGLKIAEFDLNLRGPGEVYGMRQSGIPNLKVAKIDDINLIKNSRHIAERLFEEGVKEIKLFS